MQTEIPVVDVYRIFEAIRIAADANDIKPSEEFEPEFDRVMNLIENKLLEVREAAEAALTTVLVVVNAAGDVTAITSVGKNINKYFEEQGSMILTARLDGVRDAAPVLQGFYWLKGSVTRDPATHKWTFTMQYEPATNMDAITEFMADTTMNKSLVNTRFGDQAWEQNTRYPNVEEFPVERINFNLAPFA